MQRRLATIVIADVVGYSALIHRDEAGTRARFKALETEIVAPLIAAHAGRLIKTMGDAFFLEFASAVEAVAFAAQLQTKTAEKADVEPEDRRIILRIGINLGDVIVEGDDIHGEGVNIAARLESIAKPGGVCLSRKVYEEVQGKLDLKFADGGVQALKNIENPVNVYHLIGRPGAPPVDPARRKKAKVRAGEINPIINVQPFKMIGRNEEVADLAEGLREAMIAGLAAFSALEVSRETNSDRADYVIEGGVRGSGNRVRVSVSLHDTAKGVEVWAQRYDRTLDDVLELEDQISSSVIAVIHHRLKALEMEYLENTSNDDLTVQQLLSKAAGYFVKSPGNNEPAKKSLVCALEKEPGNSMGHAMMAFCIWRICEFSPLEISADDRKVMQSHIDRALQLDQRSYFAMVINSILREELFADYRGSLDYAERALQLNPNYNPANGSAAIAWCNIGGVSNKIDALRKVIAADPEDPFRIRLLRELGLVLLMVDKFDEAGDVMRRLLQEAPELCRNGLNAVGIYWIAGQKEAARKCTAALLKRYPDLAISTMRTINFVDDEQKQRFQSALKGAGLPA